MISKDSLRVAVVGAALALATLALAGLASPAFAGPAGLASVGTPLYPDLRSTSPTALRLRSSTVNGEVRHRIIFNTRLWNKGQGAFELDGISDTSGITSLTQRIYESPVGFRDEPIGSAIVAPLDFLTVPDVTRFELWTERAFNRAARRDFSRGQPLFVRDNITHCVADIVQMDPDAGAAVGAYEQCTTNVVGISVGWADVQEAGEFHQSVDVGTTPLPDGDYVLRAIADPYNHLFESADKADPARESQVANSGVTYFRIIAGQLAGIS